MKIQPTNSSVIEKLVASGWSERRDVVVDHWSQWYRDEGYGYALPALDVLRSFGGLRIVPPVSDDAQFYSGPILFDPIIAATGESSRIRKRSARLGGQLYPIGEWTSEYILLLADTGEVYAELPFQLLRVAGEFSLALEVLVLANRELKEVSFD